MVSCQGALQQVVATRRMAGQRLFFPGQRFFKQGMATTGLEGQGRWKTSLPLYTRPSSMRSRSALST